MNTMLSVPAARFGRQQLSPENIAEGAITWLSKPTRADQTPTNIKTGTLINEGAFNHPVLVLQVQNSIATFVQITSYRSTDLVTHAAEKLKGNRKFQHSVPIYASASWYDFHQYGIPCLYLDTPIQSMAKQSYVNLATTYEAPVSTLSSYQFASPDAKTDDLKLCRASYLWVMQYVGLSLRTRGDFNSRNNLDWESVKDLVTAVLSTALKNLESPKPMPEEPKPEASKISVKPVGTALQQPIFEVRRKPFGEVSASTINSTRALESTTPEQPTEKSAPTVSTPSNSTQAKSTSKKREPSFMQPTKSSAARSAIISATKMPRSLSKLRGVVRQIAIAA
jgi:hypothetical protein